MLGTPRFLNGTETEVLHLLRTMTRRKMSRLDLAKLRFSLLAKLCRIWTAIAEIAALRQIDRAWHIALKKYSFSLTLNCRIGNRNSGKKCFRIRMTIFNINILAVCNLNK